MTVTGAFSLLTLTDNDGAEHNFRLCPLTDRDYDSLDLWLRREIIQRGLEAIPETITQDTRESLHKALMQDASSVTWMTPRGARMLCTIDGIAYMTWLAVKEEHPDVKLDWLRRLMKNHVNAQAATLARQQTQPVDTGVGKPTRGKKPLRNKSTK